MALPFGVGFVLGLIPPDTALGKLAGFVRQNEAAVAQALPALGGLKDKAVALWPQLAPELAAFAPLAQAVFKSVGAHMANGASLHEAAARVEAHVSDGIPQVDIDRQAPSG